MDPMPLTADPNPDGQASQRLERTSTRAMARMRFDLQWESPQGRHTDSLVSTRINLWRDLFPPALEPLILDQPVGHQVAWECAPGELAPVWQESNLRHVRTDQFNRHFMPRGLVQPRTGRYYPKGILEGIDGVFRMNRHPFRLIEVGDDSLLADFNHPLADQALRLSVTIEDIWTHGEERGGRCTEIGELVCAEGPGMQARWRGRPTDFCSDHPYLRADPRPDAEFYAGPRFVDHLDRTAISEISALYDRLLPRGARLLDLMASWHSHLPEAVEPAEVTGLGLNQDELAANPILKTRLVHDLNQTPALPFPDGAFDTVLCTVSVEYLTRPFEVFREVARVLRPGGHCVVTFSNRWFPPKVIQVWEGLHEFERLGLVSEYFLESGRFGHLETWSLRGLPRPADDKYADRLPLADPVYAVWAERIPR